MYVCVHVSMVTGLEGRKGWWVVGSGYFVCRVGW